jgi:hypothetical protein
MRVAAIGVVALLSAKPRPQEVLADESVSYELLP